MALNLSLEMQWMFTNATVFTEKMSFMEGNTILEQWVEGEGRIDDVEEEVSVVERSVRIISCVCCPQEGSPLTELLVLLGVQ